jgi:hypothetical protein
LSSTTSEDDDGREGVFVSTESTALAATAATAVVTLLTTDAWEQAKSGIAGLWREKHPDRAVAVEAELSAAHAELMASDQSLEGQIRHYLLDEWRGRLGRLLAAEPEIATQLRRLLHDLGTVAPPETTRSDVHGDRSVAVGGDVTGIVSTGDSSVNNSISGGTFRSPVLQGRDFSGSNFTTAASPPAAPEAETPPTEG